MKQNLVIDCYEEYRSFPVRRNAAFSLKILVSHLLDYLVPTTFCLLHLSYYLVQQIVSPTGLV